ncbi:hypothetical protein VTN00DRAFT_7568 [Thermoascus crustaceus]|uniref:uncharacterized protein n=1 Tax=Thermoascus crustaceus TaxID=5088 RepID=UPI003744877D
MLSNLTQLLRSQDAADDKRSDDVWSSEQDQDQDQTSEIAPDSLRRSFPIRMRVPSNSPQEEARSPQGSPTIWEKQWMDDWDSRQSEWASKKSWEGENRDDGSSRQNSEIQDKAIDSRESGPTLPTMPAVSDNLCMPLLLLDDGDTLVYIEPAPQSEPEGTSPSTASKSYTAPHRVRSQSLLGTGSEFFRRMFEPRYQTRVLRRRGLTGNFPKGIKYILDLTPPSEGDDAVIFMTELSCPMGVRIWAQSQQRWQLPLSCVGGQEEIEWLDVKINSQGTSPTSPSEKQQAKEKQAKPVPSEKSPQKTDVPKTDPTSQPPAKVPGLPRDYSPVRHRTCIERILHTLEGLEPRLDTPPKLWTFFAVAKLFDVAAKPPICDYILSWLYEQSNALFIELHPETTYRIACGIQCSNLCRATFAILIGEEALLLTHKPERLSNLRRQNKTIYGRVRERLDDTELQRLEYASKSFMERILRSFIDFVGVEMRWLTELNEFQKLADSTLSANSSFVSIFIRRLKEYIRFHVCKLLCTHRGTQVPKHREWNGTDSKDYPGNDWIKAYSNMRCVERVMSRTFWLSIQDTLSRGNFYIESRPQSFPLPESVADLARHLPVFNGQEDAKIADVTPFELNHYLMLVNQIPGAATAPSTSTGAPPAPFDLAQLLQEAAIYVEQISYKMLESPVPETEAYGAQFELVDTLTCLSHDEFRFLPLWAGGDDDGSGGVFTDPNIPMVEAGGFSATGPSIHTGSTTPSADSFSVISASEAASTAQVAPHKATGGYATDVMSVSSLWEKVSMNKDQDLKSVETLLEDLDIDEDEFGADFASVSSGTVVMDSPNLVDPLNDEEELNLEEGEPDLSADHT